MNFLIALFTILLINNSHAQGYPPGSGGPIHPPISVINKQINHIPTSTKYLVGWELYVSLLMVPPIPWFEGEMTDKTKRTASTQKIDVMNFDAPPTISSNINFFHYQAGLKTKDVGTLGDAFGLYYSKAYYAPADLEFQGKLYNERKNETIDDALISFVRLGPGTTLLKEEILVEDGEFYTENLAPGYYKIEVIEPKKCAGVIEHKVLITENLKEDLQIKCNSPYKVTINFVIDSEVHSIDGEMSWDDVYIEYAQRTREDYSDDDWIYEFNPIMTFSKEDALVNDEDGEEGELYNENGDRIKIPFRNEADLVLMNLEDGEMAEGLINLSFGKSTESTPTVDGTMFDELECHFDTGEEEVYFFTRRPPIQPLGWLDDIMDDTDDDDDDWSDGDDEETEMPLLEVQVTDQTIESTFVELEAYRVYFNWGVNIVCKHPDPEQYGEAWITLDASLMNFDKKGQTLSSFSSQLDQDDSENVLTALKKNEHFSITTEKELSYGDEMTIMLTITIEGDPSHQDKY
ncbi:MAG: hypothetical protein KAG61_04910 [Bacteriovoracaceae bacterium]|nr:hypothetical protein [Bacteriovoracaceae bacterium]